MCLQLNATTVWEVVRKVSGGSKCKSDAPAAVSSTRAGPNASASRDASRSAREQGESPNLVWYTPPSEPTANVVSESD